VVHESQMLGSLLLELLGDDDEQVGTIDANASIATTKNGREGMFDDGTDGPRRLQIE